MGFTSFLGKHEYLDARRRATAYGLFSRGRVDVEVLEPTNRCLGNTRPVNSL